MAEILGIGATHYPPGLVPEEYKPWPLARMLNTDRRIPERMRDPSNWPEPMRREWGEDEGITAHKAHKARVFDAFRRIRTEIDAFEPDFIVMWGDDQYENFKEDIIPPFCVLAYDAIEHRPWAEAKWANAWEEAKDTTFSYKGHRAAAKRLTTGLIESGFDVSYAYRPLHHPLGHAFMNTLLFLDYDRQGFPYPVIPFQVNCYGRRVIAQHGTMAALGTMTDEERLDPPSPAPWRCFDLGKACARLASAGPWRVALVASSSWFAPAYIRSAPRP